MAPPAEDPIRAEVERVLHAVVDVTVRAPVRIAIAVPRCVLRRAARFGPFAEPVRVVQSFVDLVGAGTSGVVTPDDAPAPDEPVVSAAPEPPAAAVDGRVHDLPIEDYESLAASHVVDRLSRLSPEELRVIHAFEVAHRGRRTVLGRVEQLLA